MLLYIWGGGVEQQPHGALFVPKRQFCVNQNWLFAQSEAEWDFLGGCLRLCLWLEYIIMKLLRE